MRVSTYAVDRDLRGEHAPASSRKCHSPSQALQELVGDRRFKQLLSPPVHLAGGILDTCGVEYLAAFAEDVIVEHEVDDTSVIVHERPVPQATPQILVQVQDGLVLHGANTWPKLWMQYEAKHLRT